MKKKTIAVTLLIASLAIFSCEKEKATDPVAEPVTATPVTPVFGDGFKVEDNTNQTVLYDSAYAYSNTNNDKYYIKSFKGEFSGVSLVFKSKILTAKTYPVDSLDLTLSSINYGAYGFDIKSGSIIISSVSNTRISGTFILGVQANYGTSTRTQVTGTFNNVKVKS